jgi:hypothetical protein
MVALLGPAASIRLPKFGERLHHRASCSCRLGPSSLPVLLDGTADRSYRPAFVRNHAPAPDGARSWSGCLTQRCGLPVTNAWRSLVSTVSVTCRPSALSAQCSDVSRAHGLRDRCPPLCGDHPFPAGPAPLGVDLEAAVLPPPGLMHRGALGHPQSPAGRSGGWRPRLGAPGSRHGGEPGRGKEPQARPNVVGNTRRPRKRDMSASTRAVPGNHRGRSDLGIGPGMEAGPGGFPSWRAQALRVRSPGHSPGREEEHRGQDGDQQARGSTLHWNPRSAEVGLS